MVKGWLGMGRSSAQFTFITVHIGMIHILPPNAHSNQFGKSHTTSNHKVFLGHWSNFVKWPMMG